MKKMIFIITCMLAVGMTFQSCTKTDAQIKNDVDRALEGRYNNALSTSVNDGVVTLTGMVDSQQQKMAAENDVKAVKNVKAVMNNISIRETRTNEPVISDDNTIRTSIESRLRTEGFSGVKVEVMNGEVRLTGDVKRDDLSKVIQIANESNPRRVTNNITLK